MLPKIFIKNQIYILTLLFNIYERLSIFEILSVLKVVKLNKVAFIKNMLTNNLGSPKVIDASYSYVS